MIKQLKTLEIFARFKTISQGTKDILVLLGETSPRSIAEWDRVAKLANSKPDGFPWNEWKRKNMTEVEKKTEQRTKEYQEKGKKKSTQTKE